MNDDVAIKIEHISKTFKLPHEKQSSLKGSLINFHKRKKGYEIQKALEDISFDVKKGEFFGIVGRNGSGKSTLLKMLAGIYAPSAGNIGVFGKLTPFIELGVGFNPELSGRDNIFLNGALLGFSRKEMQAMYHDIVAFAELERFMDQKLKNYSSGMQVRLAFSIAIRAQSDILVLDEVLAVGDALFQKKCFEYFAKLKKEKRTVILVSHDSDALLRFCDRGVLIEKGRVLTEGNIEKVVDRYKEILIEEDIKNDQEPEATKETSHKKATIKSCKTRNATGYTKTFDYEEGVEVELNIAIRTEMESLNVGIGIYNGQYEAHADRVFGANTQLERLAVPATSRTINLKIEKPELRNGKYLIYAVLFGEAEQVPYDFVEEIAEFRVRGAPDLKSNGVIIADHEWRFV